MIEKRNKKVILFCLILTFIAIAFLLWNFVISIAFFVLISVFYISCHSRLRSEIQKDISNILLFDILPIKLERKARLFINKKRIELIRSIKKLNKYLNTYFTKTQKQLLKKYSKQIELIKKTIEYILEAKQNLDNYILNILNNTSKQIDKKLKEIKRRKIIKTFCCRIKGSTHNYPKPV